MIGGLPTSLEVGGRLYPIRTDFRVVLTVLEAYADPELNDYERAVVCLECLYEQYPPEEAEAALVAAVCFIDGGEFNDDRDSGKPSPRLMDWEQDERLIFSAVNKVAGFEVRAVEYLHWWTFLGYFSEIGEGSFATVVSIRSKLAKGEKLEKWERDYYRDNRRAVKLEKRCSEEEKGELERLNSIFK